MTFKALKRIKPINPLGRILGVSKDRYGRNMAIEPEDFKYKVKKFETSDKNTGADFMNIVDELDDEQLSSINKAYKQKSEADKVLRPFGLDRGQPQESWMNWRTEGVEQDRKEGKRIEKNKRSSWEGKAVRENLPR